MTYKVVITGNQRYLIEDLYVGLENSFSCITSSSITSDLEKHIQFYKPEILLVNLDDDTKKLTKMMNQIQWIINDRQIIVVVIGDQEEIDLYAKTVLRPADIYLAKPLRNSTIVDTVIKFTRKVSDSEQLNRADL